MRKTCSFLATVLLLFVTNVDAQENDPSAAQMRRFASTGWLEEQAVLEKTLFIRAKALEDITGIKFGENWVPKVSLEWSLGSKGGFQAAAEYHSETETVYLSVPVWKQLEAQFNKPLRYIDPEILAKDDTFGILLDHELGHVLADIVSRRVKGKPFFISEYFRSLPLENQLGLNIVSEGIGTFFENARQKSEPVLNQNAFPSNSEKYTDDNYKIIAYQGGYWLVYTIISEYGERGLVWLVSNPLFANTDFMRDSVVTYRGRALQELALERSSK